MWPWGPSQGTKTKPSDCEKGTRNLPVSGKASRLPGVSPASRSHPRSRPGRDRAAAARSSRGLLQPWSCDRGESNLGCPCSPVTHPGPTASDRVGRNTHNFPSTQRGGHTDLQI